MAAACRGSLRPAAAAAGAACTAAAPALHDALINVPAAGGEWVVVVRKQA